MEGPLTFLSTNFKTDTKIIKFVVALNANFILEFLKTSIYTLLIIH